ncbi:MAG: primosomal protein N' [Gammaproteobacteria bacterium]|nr:MAG: primosomal protein N' [Gammaproteobacteria bacterium]
MPISIVLEIALPTPLRRRFDYLPPVDMSESELHKLTKGVLVRVPFGSQEMTGVLLQTKTSSDTDVNKLRPALAINGSTPAFDSDLVDFILWAADYYQCPQGEALSTALPVLLRQGEAAEERHEICWQLTTEGKGLPVGALKRAPKQALLLDALQQTNKLTRSDIAALEIPANIIKTLADKGIIEKTIADTSSPEAPTNIFRQQPLSLSNEQQIALDQIVFNQFQVSLLDGATGSGKTEIYLQAIAKVLEQGKQALVLVPEIGLTPQTIARFQRRFAVEVATLHSGLNDRERLDAWLAARSGKAQILIGTRSAIFTPMPKLGIVIVDEEHDGSFKQQDGFRYSARDLAVVRANRLNIPLILGSATASLESLNNAQQGRYQHLHLHRRAGNAKPPEIQLQDIRGQSLHEGFSQETKIAIGAEIAAGNQVLVFLNRRGYAPTLECHDCGWLANCPHCDLRMTVHQTPRHLHCHHCGHQRALPRQCPSCKSSKLQPLGQGTERSEIALREWFPNTPVIRVDRDSTRAKNAMDKILSEVHQGEPCILIGTQMLAKGHHFADVTLVVIIDADAGLFSTDFRGPERMGQLLLQVSGRAGREEKLGRVILQSLHTDHPLVQTLFYQGYKAFADLILQERLITELPPYRYLALLRAESKRPELALEFLKLARAEAQQIFASSPSLNYLGPLPSMIEKRGDRFRFQLQFNSAQRKPLQHLLTQLVSILDSNALSKRVRWAVDVDPSEMG